MKITLGSHPLDSIKADLLVVPVGSKKPEKDAQVRKLDRLLGGQLLAHMKHREFSGKHGAMLRIPGGGLAAKELLLLGVGDGKPDPAQFRRLGAEASHAGRNRPTLALVPGKLKDAGLTALADGLVCGSYRYTEYLTGDRVPKTPLQRVQLSLPQAPTAAQRAAVRDGIAVGEGINTARDLVNCPPNDLTATEMAKVAVREMRAAGGKCKVFDKRGIEKLGMPLLLAVNRGSKEEPRFIHMSYRPPGTKKLPKVVFVGKGLTFDSGGLCTKPPGSMLGMKCDMAGAAVTIGIMIAAARLKLPLEVHGLIGSTDNMSGSDAYRPGDVFPSRAGKSVEIINTDAEGRLVLADALAYATELSPDYLIDHATLTGAAMVALGNHRAALFSNDAALGKGYRSAAERSGEKYWQMPLDHEMRSQLKSTIADLKHTGSPYGGTITAALFLHEFVGDCKWAHLDIAGPSFLDGRKGTSPQGGTGFGVLTALEFLRGLV